ncbi:N-acyl homoserine lactonase family protein [Nostoc edaphicum]|uniref:N-acyl homoserine lactonase family protein n=1 Tax=Nostoc edaphicum TaxID=264686 RepID=UPI002AD5131C|nr:N-acyl homoserine lactonase family protein [Nostoc edaphicum]
MKTSTRHTTSVRLLRRRYILLIAALLSGAIVWLAGLVFTPAHTSAAVERMFVLNCGEARVSDISQWSPGINVGLPMTFSNNCYLIQHGNDWMLWDMGVPDDWVGTPEGVVGSPGVRGIVNRTLVSQLDEIGVKPADVTIIALSHAHFDHVGNTRLFPRAKWYVQKVEYKVMFGSEYKKFRFVPTLYSTLRNNPVVTLQGDHDIFGDGSVRILSTPGHTPGHQSLLVRLPQTGLVVLSGDVAHFEENFVNRRVPRFNADAKQTRQSMNKVDAIVKNQSAQLWINHDLAQSASIPRAPKAVK